MAKAKRERRTSIRNMPPGDQALEALERLERMERLDREAAQRAEDKSAHDQDPEAERP
jgi:hypothetical protein